MAGLCASSRASGACAPADALGGVTDLAISADGRFAYATAFRDSAVDAFARDPQTGALTQLPGPSGCLAAQAGAGCAAGRGLKGAYNLTLSPDGRQVYVASRFSAAVAVLARDPATGALGQVAGAAGCVSSLAGEGCGSARGLTGARGVAVSPDGRSVYGGAYSDSAVTAFARAADGSLRQLPGRAGCDAQAATPPGCTHARAVHQAWGIAVSPDSRFVYTGVGGDRNSGLAVFSRDR